MDFDASLPSLCMGFTNLIVDVTIPSNILEDVGTPITTIHDVSKLHDRFGCQSRCHVGSEEVQLCLDTKTLGVP